MGERRATVSYKMNRKEKKIINKENSKENERVISRRLARRTKG